jgi:hypothetical protein
MRSLVTFAPGHLPFAIAMPGEICELDGSPTCVISHELSNHPPPAYLWDQDMRDYFALAEQGHMLVANMHADDLDQAHAQICEDNDVPEAHFRAARLFIFLRMEGEPDDARRLVDTVHHSEGTGAHRPVFSRPGGLSSSAPRDSVHEAHCRRFLEQALARSERASEDLRRLFLRSATPEAS